MSRLDDIRKTVEATVGGLNTAKAQELARSLLDPGTAKEQVSKTATELLEWSQRNRERIAELVRKEIAQQMRNVGAATQADVDALEARVRELERAAGIARQGRKKAPAAAKPKSPAKTKPTAKSMPKARATAKGTASGASEATAPKVTG